jgi:aryl-alcohol dehydrogenase-like predicted oxidoreductase
MGNAKSDLTRRRFMTTTAGCLASAGLASFLPGAAAAQEQTADSPTSGGEIIYRTLGRTGMKVPVVSMGAGACNDPGLVQACYEAGMRLFDTAATYAFGRNEQMIAKAIHRLGVRQKSLIVTKGLGGPERRGVTPEQSKRRLIANVDGSLRRLKTDYLDCFMLYDVRDVEPVRDEAVKEALVQVKKEGKIRSIGLSTHASMAAVIDAATEAEIYDVILTAFNFTMANDEIMDSVARAAEKGIGIIAMKSQAGGTAFPNPETLRSYDGATINSAALKWVLNNKNITTAIPGIGTYDHLRANMAVASNLAYTEAEKSFLADNSIKLGMGFCKQCSKCLASCPNGADIPNLMRTHMYAAQYGDFRLARTTLDEIPRARSLSACGSCDSCVAECANATVPIKQKIDELKLIYA